MVDEEQPEQQIADLGFDKEPGVTDAMFGPKTDAPKLPDWLQGATAISPAMADALSDPPADGTKTGSSKMDEILQQLQTRQKELEQEGKGILGEERQGTRAMIEALQASNKRVQDVPIPQLERSPRAPQANLAQGSMEWVQAATLMASMAGGFIRRGGTAALTAFSGAIKGYAEGRREDFDAKSQEFKLASEQVKQDNQDRIDQYKMIMSNEKLSIDNKLSQFKLAAAMWQDEMTYNAAERKDVGLIAQLMQKNEQWNSNYAARTLDQQIKLQNLQDRQRKQADLETNAHQTAEGIRDGSLPPTSAYVGNYGGKQIVMADLAKFAKQGTFNLARANLEWQAAVAAVKNTNSAQMARNMQVAQASLETMDEAIRLGNLMKQGNVPLINELKLMKKTGIEANSPQGQLATQYVTAIEALKNELPLLESGGFAPHEAQINSVIKQINQNMGQYQLIADIAELKKVIRRRINAIPYIQQYGPLAPNPYTGQTENKMPAIYGGSEKEDQVGGENADPLGLR
jgi:hypothetical protein